MISLLREQNYVCVYCGKSITAASNSSHIEHFWPQSKFENLRFDWINLFASCGPSGQKGVPRICGDAKEDWIPSDHIELTDPQCEQKFSFDGNGGISPSSIGGKPAQTMIDHLNLTDSTLEYERKLIIRQLEEDIANGLINASNKAFEIQMWRSVDIDGKIKGYGHVAARYLEDENL